MTRPVALSCPRALALAAALALLALLPAWARAATDVDAVNVVADTFLSGDDEALVIFQAEQNQGDKAGTVARITAVLQDGMRRPVMEYKKVSPVKYRLVFHKITTDFAFIFAENFSPAWGAFPVAWRQAPPAVDMGLVDRYQVRDGGRRDQAGREELRRMVRDGVISTLGNGKEKLRPVYVLLPEGGRRTARREPYVVDQVSTESMGNIENLNLADGPVDETWGRPALDEAFHVTANGFANCWFVDLDRLRRDFPGTLRPEAGGAFSLELVLEHRKQRVFLASTAVSAAALVACLACLAWGAVRRRRALRR